MSEENVKGVSSNLRHRSKVKYMETESRWEDMCKVCG